MSSSYFPLLTASTTTSHKMNKYEFTILKGIWSLEVKYLHLLEYKQTFITTVDSFVSRMIQEEYPSSYEDSLEQDGTRYHISYLFTSGLFLEDLSRFYPKTPVAYQLRSNKENNFYYCLVRKFDRQWTIKSMLELGAKEIT